MRNSGEMVLARLLSVLLLPPVLAVAVVYLGTGSVWFDGTQRAREPGRVVTWGDRAFTNRRGFAMWLESTGQDYRAWAKRHPGAAARLGKPAPPQSAVARGTALDRDRASASPPAVRWTRSGLLALAGGAMALLAIAVLRRLPHASIRMVSVAAYGADAIRFLSISAASAERRLAVRPRAPPLSIKSVLTSISANAAPLVRQSPSGLAASTLRAAQASRAAMVRLVAPIARPSRKKRDAGRVRDAVGREALRTVALAIRAARVSARHAGLLASAVLARGARIARYARRHRQDVAFALVGLALAVVIGILAPLMLAP